LVEWCLFRLRTRIARELLGISRAMLKGSRVFNRDKCQSVYTWCFSVLIT